MSNAIDPADLSYPDKPDNNGYAKKYYRRKAFYFGAHNTPESLLLFGEWKRQLCETGAAPEVKQVRKDLAHLRSIAPEPVPNRHAIVMFITVAACAGLLGLGFFTTQLAKILSTRKPPVVDGVVLSSEEVDVIRGLRQAETRMAKIKTDRAQRIAKKIAELKEQGPRNVSFKPPTPPISSEGP